MCFQASIASSPIPGTLSNTAQDSVIEAPSSPWVWQILVPILPILTPKTVLHNLGLTNVLVRSVPGLRSLPTYCNFPYLFQPQGLRTPNKMHPLEQLLEEREEQLKVLQEQLQR